MAIGSKRSRERRRRRGQIFLGAAKWLVILGIFLGLGWWSYQTGLDLARSDAIALERRLTSAQTEARELHARNATLDGELRQARQDMAALQQRYQRDVPAGDSAALYALAQQRIAAGIPRARVEQVLRDARPTERCEARGTSRRFAIIYGERVPADAGVTFADGLVRVVVSAPSTTDDLATAASVTVEAVGQEPATLTGLPQRHPVVLGNAELQLSVTVSDIRGFATATLAACAR